jgi:hypothetical protein
VPRSEFLISDYKPKLRHPRLNTTGGFDLTRVFTGHWGSITKRVFLNTNYLNGCLLKFKAGAPEGEKTGKSPVLPGFFKI